MKKRNSFTKEGYTLIEILVVVVLFAVVSILATQTVILILRATKKSESTGRVRQNVDYALGSIERQLRSARKITSVCDGSSASQISFIDPNADTITYSCVGTNPDGTPASIASASASLTSSDITFSACSFVCVPATSTTPPYVTINATAGKVGESSTSVTVTTQVTLRNY